MLNDVSARFGRFALTALTAALLATPPIAASAEETKPAAAAEPAKNAAAEAKAEPSSTSAPAPATAAAAGASADKPAEAAKADDAKSEPAKPAETKVGDAPASDTSAAPAAKADAAPAATPAAAPAAPQQAAAPAAAPQGPTGDEIIAAARLWLEGFKATAKIETEDVEALVKFYGELSGSPLWIEAGAFNSRAKAAMDEVRKADDWGLDASKFSLPEIAAGSASKEALAEAEATLSVELLRYARYARGGRVDPASLSRILDQVPPIKDPNVVLADLKGSTEPDAYLRGLHPKHEQFVALKQALSKLRGPKEPEAPVDEALRVKLPADGKPIKVGAEHADVALLRKRLKVPAENGAKETLFDAEVSAAVKSFQEANGLKVTGLLSKVTRQALNREGEPKSAGSKDDQIQRVLLNMERWRWMPEDLGEVYVWNNIPEFMTRTIKGKETVFTEKIIVGMPEWATPVFSATIQNVTFNPSWGMPDGIKARELAPRLRSAGGGFFFFGGGGGSSIIRAYGLNVYRDGKLVNPESVDWSGADLKRYSFVQPPGAKNPLGIVKFRFPNKHDVYMHDTIQRELFNQSYRAMSHGCIRVQNPKAFAAVLLKEGHGLSDEEAARAVASGGDISLKTPIPVHLTYFTVMADKDGNLTSFRDLYGHDNKLSSALNGRYLKVEPQLETASADAGSDAEEEPQPGKKSKKTKASKPAPEDIGAAISGIFSN